MIEQVNPQKITMAREARGLSRQNLADLLELDITTIYSIESGETRVKTERLIALADTLCFPPNFFLRPGEMIPMNLGYRKRQKVALHLLMPIEAQMNILRDHAQIITRLLKKEALQLPVFNVDEQHTPAKIADLLRRKWQTNAGPIDDMIRFCEDHGIIISSFDFRTDRVDSRCILTDDQYPIIVFNKALLGDRLRFTIAYELGHLIMHSFTDVDINRDISHEANEFAAALLMPEKEMRNEFKDGVSLELLAQLKLKWKVSMVALLYRASDLVVISDNQKRYLLERFNNLKIRKREPKELDAPLEKPGLMKKLFAELMKQQSLGINQVCDLLATTASDYLDYYG